MLAERADVAVRARRVQRFCVAVMRETPGVGPNVQPERAKRKGVPARAQNVAAVMGWVGRHLQRVGALALRVGSCTLRV